MTTIAVSRSEMAADSRTANEDGLIISDETQKIVRIGGDIIGCEGDDDYITEFLTWYDGDFSPQGRPEGIEHNQFAAVVLTAGGQLIKYFARCYPLVHSGPWLTLGSGQDIATGALAMGATPKQAVEIACRYNVWTGGPVVVERL